MSQNLPLLKVQRAASHKLIEKLLAEHAFALRRFIRVRLNSEHDSEDVLQEVYVRLSQIEDLPTKLADRLDTARNYLFQIASNLLIDRARRAQVRNYDKHISNSDVMVQRASDTYAPERVLANKRKLRSVDRALLKLKPVQRKAFLLSRVDGLSYREISDKLGLSLSTIEKHIAAALLAAREAVAKEEQHE